MSLTDGLLLHFVPEGTSPADGQIVIKDGSGGSYQISNRNVTLAQDATFGLTLSFAGTDSSLEIDNPNFNLEGDFALGGWFKFNSNSNWVRLVGKGRHEAGDESIGLWGQPSSNAWRISQQGTTPPAQVSSSEREIVPGAWYHIAAVRQSDTLTLYYNTEVAGLQNGLTGTPQASDQPLRLGYSEEFEGFNGEMAHLRVYNRALSAGEIMQMINATGIGTLIPPAVRGPQVPLNEPPGSAFKRSHPVDFALFDQSKHYALYIDDSNALGQPLTFEVHNSSDRAIVFGNNQGSTASATNYHFELQFRPGVLSPNTLGQLRDPQKKGAIITDPSDWDLFVPAAAGPAEHVSLYVLHKGDNEWPGNTRRSLRFAGINADAAGGARGTQVAMIPNRITFADSDALLTGRRTHHMSIVNRRGEKAIPLHVGFKGSNHVLNVNGAQSNLTLQIVNNLRLAQSHADIPTIPLRAAQTDQPPSRFVLEFDVQQEGEEKSWALARASELGNLTVAAHVIRRGQTTADSTAVLQITQSAQAQSLSRQWEITPQADIPLNPGDTIQVALSGVVTSLSTGPTNLYVHYDNLSGYQDGRFALPIEKSPLAYLGSNVGIGTNTPDNRLEVNGAVEIQVDAADSKLRFHIPGIAWYSMGADVSDSGSFKLNYGPNVGDATHFTMTTAGNVGIGTNTPDNTLEVNGAIEIQVDNADSKLRFHDPGQAWYSMGIDVSDNGKFKLNYGGSLGDARHFSITRTGDVDMGANLHIAGNLSVEGAIRKKFKRWWLLHLENERDWGNTRIFLTSPAQWSNSDARLKQGIEPIGQALHKIAQLNGVSYKWNADGLKYLTRNIDTHIFAGPDATEEENREAREEARMEAYQSLSGTEVGLLAQDVEKVLPQMVRTDESGYKSIQYDLLTALLVEAVKELTELVHQESQYDWSDKS